MGRVICWLGVFVFLLGGGQLSAGGPSVLYLTWMHDPTTTMTVQWHSSKLNTNSVVSYHKAGETVWEEARGSCTLLDQSDVAVHAVELDGLQPDTLYQFRLKGKKIYSFRTLPQTLSRPVKFVVGADAYFHLSTFRQMNQQVAACNPDFVVIGGDIAHSHNSRALFKEKGWELDRWRRFFKEWKEQMVTSDGCLIPLIPVLGHHDIKRTTLCPKSHYFFFYDMFALPEKGVSYRALDAGNYLSLFLLDTGHSYHIEGQQTRWLDKELSFRQSVPYKMAAYDIGAYPSVYSFYGVGPKKIRANWCPLFERHQLQVAFEHQSHAYKRSFPMKRGQIDSAGVIYMGDGSWGGAPRKPKEFWYLNKSAQSNAVCLVTLTSEKGKVEGLDITGKIIDSVEILPAKVALAWDERNWPRYTECEK